MVRYFCLFRLCIKHCVAPWLHQEEVTAEEHQEGQPPEPDHIATGGEVVNKDLSEVERRVHCYRHGIEQDRTVKEDGKTLRRLFPQDALIGKGWEGAYVLPAAFEEDVNPISRQGSVPGWWQEHNRPAPRKSCGRWWPDSRWIALAACQAQL